MKIEIDPTDFIPQILKEDFKSLQEYSFGNAQLQLAFIQVIEYYSSTNSFNQWLKEADLEGLKRF